MPENKSQIRFSLTLLVILWGVLANVNISLADWSGPTSTPPGGGVAPFLNTDVTSQTKLGQLTIDNNFYVVGGGTTGLVGLGTSSATTARLVINPYTGTAIDAGNGAIITTWTPTAYYDVVTKGYFTEVLGTSVDSLKYWTLSGNNLYASSTAWNIGIGLMNPGARLGISASGTPSTTPALSILGSGAYGSGYQVAWGNYAKLSQNSSGAHYISWGMYNNGSNWVRSYTSGNNYLPYLGFNTNSRLEFGGSVSSSTTDTAPTLSPKIIFDMATGNVGIGTSSPAAKLDVAGTVKTGIIYDDFDLNYYLDLASNGGLLYSLKVKGDIITDGGVIAATSSAAQMKSNAYCDASGNNCFNPTGGWSSAGYFATVTSAVYTGTNNGNPGYAYAHTQCSNQFSGSHVCTAEEMLNTIRENRTMPSVDVWIFNGPPGYTAMANDCDGRRNSTTGAYGAYWQMSDSSYLPSGRGLLFTCEKSVKLACCK